MKPLKWPTKEEDHAYMKMRREYMKACDEHEERFRATFELKPEYRGDAYWEAAFDCAARYKLYADDMNIVGEAIQRKPEPRLKDFLDYG